MKKRNLAGLFLSCAFVLGVALPGTMAMPADADGTDAAFADKTEEHVTLVIATDSNASSDAENGGDKNPVDYETATGSNAKAPVVPGTFVHIDTCLEGCTGEGCECACHLMSLYERLMACTSLEEISAVLDETTEEELLVLTEEQNRSIGAHIESLEPEPLPAVEINGIGDSSVPSEIIYQTVSFDNVAPFGEPVTGGAE